MATYKKRSYVGLTTENVEWHGKRGLLMPNVWTVGIRVVSYLESYYPYARVLVLQ